jgi:hypothetical protein
MSLVYGGITFLSSFPLLLLRYHIRIFHEKFEVSNTRDLLKKAHDLGFVDIG